jgi:hypothetical protein
MDIINLKPEHKPAARVLRCARCGITQEAACGCGFGYVPAVECAAAAVAKHPEKSDRAIAAALGVSDKTVAKARASTAEKSAVAKRVGRDGKARKRPAKLRLRIVQPPDEADRANAVMHILSDAMQEFEPRFREWLASEPPLKAKEAMRGILETCKETISAHAAELSREEMPTQKEAAEESWQLRLVADAHIKKEYPASDAAGGAR